MRQQAGVEVNFTNDTIINHMETIKSDYIIMKSDYKVQHLIGREFTKNIEIIDYIDGYAIIKILERLAEDDK